jgi:hypothetical protein
MLLRQTRLLKEIQDKVTNLPSDPADQSLVIAEISTAIDKIDALLALGNQAKEKKAVTFSNTADDVTIFTVTGDVIVKLTAVCKTNLASADGCNLAVKSGAVTLIATTASTDIDANEIWHDATPDASVEALSVQKEHIISNGQDIVLDVETAKQVDSGAITFYCIWTPLSDDGYVEVAS